MIAALSTWSQAACGRALRESGGQIRVLPLDLAALSSVHAFVDIYRTAGLPPLAALICNAGVQGNDTPTRTKDGFEATFGINHLAHYLLARLMLSDLAAGGRIVFVASNTHDPATRTGMPAPLRNADLDDRRRARRRVGCFRPRALL